MSPELKEDIGTPGYADSVATTAAENQQLHCQEGLEITFLFPRYEIPSSMPLLWFKKNSEVVKSSDKSQHILCLILYFHHYIKIRKVASVFPLPMADDKYGQLEGEGDIIKSSYTST